MEVKKDIGKAFREKLDGLERQPNDALWNAISKDLDKENKKKSRFPFFWLYIVSCTFIGISVTAFVLSNLDGEQNMVDAKPETQNNITYSRATESASESGNNNIKDTSVTGAPAENSSIINESVPTTKNASNKNNPDGPVATTPTKNKVSLSKDQLNKTQQIKTENEGFATNGNNNNSAGYRKQPSKHSSSTTGNLQKTSNASKSRQSKPYTQKGREYATSPVNNSLPTNSYNDNGSNSTVSQSGNKNTPVNPTASVQTTTNDSNNLSLDKENTASAIDTKIIGKLNTLTVSDSSTIAVDSLKTVITDIKEEEKKADKKDSIPPVPFKKFSVYAYGGPSYFSFPSRTIVTDSTTSNINTKSTTRFGVLFGYRLTNKLSIRTGFSLYKLKQSANNIKLNYIMGDAINGGLIPTPDFNWIDYQQPFGTNSGVIIGQLGENYQAIINIDRELSYMEVPLEISYNLFDKRFGLDVFGGGSMLLLNKNDVTAYNEKGKMYLGEWNAAAKTSFTGMLGLGLHYKLTPSLQLNTEPVFNYYFNTYKDSKPYSFTIRLGLQYNFDF